MQKKTKLRIVQMLCIISILMTFFSIQKTYAKYYEKLGTKYQTTIKRWVINVNDYDIHNLTSLNDEATGNAVMTPVFINDDYKNNNNTLVPGREGYFPFVIDYSKVDLTFRYGFDITQLNKKTITDETTGEETIVDAHLTDFNIFQYEIIDGTGSSVFDEKIAITNLTDISTVIDPKNATITYKKDGTDTAKTLDSDKKVEIRVWFKWDEDGTMSNADDTAFKGEANTAVGADSIHTLLKYNVKIKFTQVI